VDNILEGMWKEVAMD